MFRFNKVAQSYIKQNKADILCENMPGITTKKPLAGFRSTRVNPLQELADQLSKKCAVSPYWPVVMMVNWTAVCQSLVHTFPAPLRAENWKPGSTGTGQAWAPGAGCLHCSDAGCLAHPQFKCWQAIVLYRKCTCWLWPGWQLQLQLHHLRRGAWVVLHWPENQSCRDLISAQDVGIISIITRMCRV